MEENLGMVMGFTVISAALEWLGSTWDTLQLEEEERLKRKKELEEEEEKVHFWPELGYKCLAIPIIKSFSNMKIRYTRLHIN